MRYITILLLFLSGALSGQMQFVKPEQTPAWFPFNFEQADSIGIIEQNGRDGGTFELLLVYPDSLFQIVTVTYDDVSKKASAEKARIRDAEYLRNRIAQQRAEIEARAYRDSMFITKYLQLDMYLEQFIDTSQIVIPGDTTGN